MTVMLSPKIKTILDKLRDPISDHVLSSPDLLDFAEVRNSALRIILRIDHGRIDEYERHKLAWERALNALPDISRVEIGFTAIHDGATKETAAAGTNDKKEPPYAADFRKRAAKRRGPPPPLPKPAKRILAVASAKGGVGKSTVAVNLALALARSGMSCGLLDADIYGPSIPKLLDIQDKPEQKDGKIIPIYTRGIRTMSMGFFLKDNSPLIWRGPMVMSAIEQMLRDVAWDNPDVIVVDLPPGTGDAQLTLVQRVTLDAVLIVTTPQEIALIDVRRGIEMFRKVNVPILGIVENMTYITCPSCSEKHYLFGKGRTQALAKKYKIKILSQLPIMPELSHDADLGKQIEPDSEAGALFDTLATTVSSAINPKP